MALDTGSTQRLAEFLDGDGRTAVVCLGNEYKGDDGAGVALAARLKGNTGENAVAIDAGRNLLSALKEIEDARPSRILFVDAADMGKGPGEVLTIEGDEISEAGLSTHENNLPLALSYLNNTLPGLDVLFLGIQFGDMGMTEGLKLTKEMERAVGEVADLLASLL